MRRPQRVGDPPTEVEATALAALLASIARDYENVVTSREGTWDAALTVADGLPQR